MGGNLVAPPADGNLDGLISRALSGRENHLLRHPEVKGNRGLAA
jgi:hypothetical protein